MRIIQKAIIQTGYANTGYHVPDNIYEKLNFHYHYERVK